METAINFKDMLKAAEEASTLGLGELFALDFVFRFFESAWTRDLSPLSTTNLQLANQV